MKIQPRYWIATLSDGTRLRIPIVRRGRPPTMTLLDKRRAKAARRRKKPEPAA